MWPAAPFAAAPAACEPPSAGFALDWATIGAPRERGIAFATITLAAGLIERSDRRLDRVEPCREAACAAAAA